MLDTQRLLTFEAVVRIGSFAGAARELGYTQPGVSQQMKALERDLKTTLFAREGGTVMQYVWERRLVNAASRLARRTARAVTVTEVAHACGFQDAPHFSRMFRQRFGRSPSAWRGTD